MILSDVLNFSRQGLQSALQGNDANGCWTDELCAKEFDGWTPTTEQVRWDSFCLMLAEQNTKPYSIQHFVIARVKAAIAELKCEKWLKVCKNLSDVHDHCDGNMIGGTEFLGQFFEFNHKGETSQSSEEPVYSIIAASNEILDFWIRSGCPDYTFEDVPILCKQVEE